MKCECGEDLESVRMMFSSVGTFFERVCFGCGWFDDRRFKTKEEADGINRQIRTRQENGLVELIEKRRIELLKPREHN